MTLKKFTKKIPGGVDAKTIAWMWKRLILILDWTHKIGYIHGAVLPPHVMYFPDNDGKTAIDPRKHAVRLVDWAYAVKMTSKAKLKAWVPEYESFYAPEILSKGKLGPWTDLYMGAKTMLYLLSGDVKKNIFPASLPAPILKSLEMCLNPDPSKRPQDAYAYFQDFTRILKQLYGPPKYHDFNLPQV